MKCKLCLKEKDLCNSHIIPEFMYKTLYDSLHRYHMVSVEPDEKNKFQQKGIREKLLCSNCEQHIGNWERYASKIYSGKFEIDNYADKEFVGISGIDYKQFKLFQLSILWRIGVASIRGFKHIKLGPHEEILRKMLLEFNPGDPNEYGCIMVSLIDEDEHIKGLTITPDSLRYFGHRAVRVIIGGMIWAYIVSNHSKMFKFKNLFLKEDGILTVYGRNASEVKMLKMFAKELSDQGKLKD